MGTGSDRLSTLSMLAAIWLFFSPWIVRPWHQLYAVDAWMVAAVTVVVLTSAMRPPRPPLSNIVVGLLGAWIVASPWVLHYTDAFGPAWNSWIIGGIIAVFSLVAAAMGLAAGRDVQPV